MYAFRSNINSEDRIKTVSIITKKFNLNTVLAQHQTQILENNIFDNVVLKILKSKRVLYTF